MSRPRPSHIRWQRWQASPQVQQALTAEQRAHGLTVMRVRPACRDAFLEVVGLLNVYGNLEEVSPEMRLAWAAWLDATCQLRAQCEQAQHQGAPHAPSLV